MVQGVVWAAALNSLYQAKMAAGSQWEQVSNCLRKLPTPGLQGRGVEGAEGEAPAPGLGTQAWNDTGGGAQ